MEHRHYPRNSEEFSVTISNPRYGSVDAKVHDISREGIALRLADMAIPAGTLVDVVLPKNQQQRFQNKGLKGYVVHAKKGVLGMWLLGQGLPA